MNGFTVSRPRRITCASFLTIMLRQIVVIASFSPPGPGFVRLGAELLLLARARLGLLFELLAGSRPSLRYIGLFRGHPRTVRADHLVVVLRLRVGPMDRQHRFKHRPYA